MIHNPDARHILLLATLTVLLWLPRLSGPIDVRFDGGVYYVLGTSLAEGKGYRLLNEPGEIEAIQYPPLLPLFVAAHQCVLATNEFLVVGPWLRVSFFLLSVAYTIAVYRLARLDLRPRQALLVAAVCALSLQTYYLSDLLYAEIPFALAMTLFVLFNRQSERRGYAVLAAAMAVVAFLLRTAGIAVLAAWVAESLLRRRFKQAAIRSAVAVVPVLLWQTYVWRVTSGLEYRQPAYAYQRAPYLFWNVSYAENTTRLIHPFYPERGWATSGDLVRRTAENLLALPEAVGEALTVPVGYVKLPLRFLNEWAGREVLPLWLAVAPFLLLGCLVLVGTVARAVREEWFVPLVLAVSVGLVCLTPWPEQFPRYLTPLMPFLSLSLVSALRFLSETCRKRCSDRWYEASMVLSALAVTALLTAQGVAAVATLSRKHELVSYYDRSGNETRHRLFFYDPPWRALDTALEWVRRRAGSADIIATIVPHTAYVRTGLRAVKPPLLVDQDEVRRLLDSVPVTYVVLDSVPYPGFSQRYAAPAVEGCPEMWKLVHVVPEGGARVYQRQR